MARWKLLATAAMFTTVLCVGAAEQSAADRGRKHLLEDNYIPAIWARDAYDQAWKRWENVTAKPADYDAAFRETYGLQPAPYPNGTLPMGLRDGPRLLGKGVSIDCLACHGGSIMGQSYVGLGNASLDVQALFEDLNAGSGLPSKLPMRFSNVRGTSEAGGMSVYLLSHRNPDLNFRRPGVDLELHDQMCEDPPAWWLLHKKKTMYQSGGADAHSVRSLMQFMMGSINGPNAFEKSEADFADIQRVHLFAAPAEISVPDRPLTRGERRDDFQADLLALPRYLRRRLDVSQQDRPDSTRLAPIRPGIAASRPSSANITTAPGSPSRNRAAARPIRRSRPPATRRRRWTASGRRRRTSTTARRRLSIMS